MNTSCHQDRRKQVKKRKQYPVLESSWKCIGLVTSVPNPERFPSGKPQGQLTTQPRTLKHNTAQHGFPALCMMKSLAALSLASFCQTRGGGRASLKKPYSSHAPPPLFHFQGELTISITRSKKQL